VIRLVKQLLLLAHREKFNNPMHGNAKLLVFERLDGVNKH
jgi:hypothetical protein